MCHGVHHPTPKLGRDLQPTVAGENRKVKREKATTQTTRCGKVAAIRQDKQARRCPCFIRAVLDFAIQTLDHHHKIANLWYFVDLLVFILLNSINLNRHNLGKSQHALSPLLQLLYRRVARALNFTLAPAQDNIFRHQIALVRSQR
eukprot:CAMPEP_0204291000 /NCGR_PEP_ID=MMETSP0468-20130131/61659_1 /ASSEMBLY_ACC=CAM_ASM_000383 /TAXON_ID=2969 /ORGANISM="Oxyrrhis marina" /LENGTH=145 /DNA_ID=CAMNT_0051269267 /DNA_START=111 /DNA_END=545 /DNA_ORIENTATION=+